jgi:sirohydrochlorin ferrochelatase
MNEALLIVGHGSKSKEAVDIFNNTVNNVRKKSSFTRVEGAHMELCPPSIEEQVKKLISENFNRIILIPYFLYMGNHIKHDIPEIISSLMKQYPSVTFVFGKPIGDEPLIADILINRALEAQKSV